MSVGESAGARSIGRPFRTWNGVARSRCLLALVLTWGTGCTLIYGNEVDKKQCKSQADCDPAAAALGTPLVCRQDTCQAPICSQTSECPANSMCVGNLCVASTTDGGTPGVACTQDGDCGNATQRCGYDGYCYEKWGCLAEEAIWPATPFKVTYVGRLLSAKDPANPAAVRDTRVEMCVLTDDSCAAPVVKPEDVTIAADATVTVPLISGASSNFFVGFVRFSSPPSDAGTEDRIVPVYRLFTGATPLVSDMVDPITINLITPQILAIFSASFGTTYDPAAGSAQFFVADCGGRPAPGMSVSAPSAPTAMFLPVTRGGPVFGSNETTAEGTGSISGLPPDKLTTFVLRDEGQQREITNTISFRVHGAAMDSMVYYPRNSALQKWLTEAKRQGLLPQQ